MEITRTSPFTGKTNTRDIPVTQGQLDAWMHGVLIQVAMPDVSPEDREFIMTGITPEEWSDTFGENNEN